MNKKLIAAAVASAFVLPMAAQAEITPYAMVQFEITDTDADGAANDTVRVNDNERGRIGVKGSHDLGDGLKAFALIELDLVGGVQAANGNAATNGDTDHGNNTTHGTRIREVVAGLSGGFGSIGLGTVKSAYKYYGGIKYDPFVATNLEARGVGMEGGTDGHNGFLNNALIYTGSFGMVDVHVTYSPDDTDRDTDVSPNNNNDDGELSAGIKFGNKTWEAGVAIYDEGVSVSTLNQENTKVFGSFTFGNNTIRAQLEATDTGAATNGETDYTWLGYELKLGKGMLNVQYAMVEPEAANTDYDMITVGYIHKFNKETRLFAGYQTVDSDVNANDVDQLSVGIRVDF